MVKGVLFDIDDTLYSHKIKMTPHLNVVLLDKLKEKGIKIGVCTSREPGEMYSLDENIASRIDCIIMSTGAVTYVKDKYYKSYPINKELTKKYVSYFEKHHIAYHYSDLNGQIFYCGDEENFKKRKFLSMTSGEIFLKPYEDEDVPNIGYYDASEDEVEEIAKISKDVYISKWGGCGHISAPLVDKSFGVLKFCQIYGFTTDEVIACGDGLNDDLMLEMAGFGIAVKDAKDNTKEKADYICKKSIEDGGLYEAFVDLKIIKEEEHHPKLFFFDIDSTSFDHKINDVRESTYLAFKRLREKGYKICINSSRAPDEARNLPGRFLKAVDCISLLGGAYIIANNQVITKKFNYDEVKEAIKFLDDENVTYRYTTIDGYSYLNRHDQDKENLFYRLYTMIPAIKKYDNEEVLGLLIYCDGEQKKRIADRFINISDLGILSIAIESYPKGVNKGLSIKDISKFYNIDIKDTCAFGDSGNDIDMFKVAGLSICMGNGYISAKQAADYITDDISDEGLYNALVHFKIIEGE